MPNDKLFPLDIKCYKPLKAQDLRFVDTPQPFKLLNEFTDKKLFDIIKESCEVLDEFFLGHWLASGTALGLYRDDRFIPHDTDIDLGVLCFEGFNYSELIEHFSIDGFVLHRQLFHEGEVMQLAFVKDFVLVDFYFYYSWTEAYFVNCNDSGRCFLPKRFFDGVTKLGGYRVPSPVAEYLRYNYGESWNIPEDGKGVWQENCPCQIGYDV